MPSLRQLGGRADAGGEQQHRRIDRAARNDQFAPRADAPDLAVTLDLDADGAVAVEQDTADLGFRHQLEIFSAQVRLEISDRRRAAPAIVDVERREADAVDALAVEIGVALVLQALAGLHKGPCRRRGALDVRHRHRAAGAAPRVGAIDAVLHPLEIGQHVVVAPAARAEALPFVIIAGCAAQEDEAVDGAGAAQNLAARPDHGSAAETRFRLGFVTPVHLRVRDQLAKAHRNVNPGITIASAGLDDAQRHVWIFRQPRRQHAAGGAGAGHDDVEFRIKTGFTHQERFAPVSAFAAEDSGRRMVWIGLCSRYSICGSTMRR